MNLLKFVGKVKAEVAAKMVESTVEEMIDITHEYYMTILPTLPPLAGALAKYVVVHKDQIEEIQHTFEVLQEQLKPVIEAIAEDPKVQEAWQIFAENCESAGRKTEKRSNKLSAKLVAWLKK